MSKKKKKKDSGRVEIEMGHEERIKELEAQYSKLLEIGRTLDRMGEEPLDRCAKWGFIEAIIGIDRALYCTDKAIERWRNTPPAKAVVWSEVVKNKPKRKAKKK